MKINKLFLAAVLFISILFINNEVFAEQNIDYQWKRNSVALNNELPFSIFKIRSEVIN